MNSLSLDPPVSTAELPVTGVVAAPTRFDGKRRRGLRRREFRIDLRMGPSALELRLGGKFTAQSADPLHAVVVSLNTLSPPIHVNTAQVTCVDRDGIAPLFEVALHRGSHARASVEIVEYSPAVRRLFTLLGLADTRQLDIAAWLRAEHDGPPAADRPQRHLRLLTP